MITKEMKDWFGNGEIDIQLMIDMGVLTEKQVLEYVHTLIDSPWYKGK